MIRSVPRSRNVLVFRHGSRETITTKRKGKTMCKYCDVRMPDGCGLELNSKNEHAMLWIYPDGHVCVDYEDCNKDGYRDSFKFNYCPMCGKPLDDDTDELLYLCSSSVKYLCGALLLGR